MKRFKEVKWFCDECDAELDRQPGFSDSCFSWTCTNCGCVNMIDEEHILDDEMADRVAFIESIVCCEECGGHNRKEMINGSYYWMCEDCGSKRKINI